MLNFDRTTRAGLNAGFSREDAAADDLYDAITDELFAAEKRNGPDAIATIYSLWVRLTRSLAEAGCTPEELSHDAACHAADQRNA